nr:MAG TPA: hypothetical protein [Caudoviricetes sp.]
MKIFFGCLLLYPVIRNDCWSVYVRIACCSVVMCYAGFRPRVTHTGCASTRFRPRSGAERRGRRQVIT